MTYRIYLTADYDTLEEANRGLSEAEEAVGKTNGDLQNSEVEDLDGEDI